MASTRACLLVLSLGWSSIAHADDDFQTLTLPPAATTPLPTTGNQNFTFFSPRVESTENSLIGPGDPRLESPQTSLIEPSRPPGVQKPPHSPTLGPTASSDGVKFQNIVVTAQTRASLDLPEATPVKKPAPQPFDEPLPNPRPSNPPDAPRPDVQPPEEHQPNIPPSNPPDAPRPDVQPPEEPQPNRPPSNPPDAPRPDVQSPEEPQSNVPPSNSPDAPRPGVQSPEEPQSNVPPSNSPDAPRPGVQTPEEPQPNLQPPNAPDSPRPSVQPPEEPHPYLQPWDTPNIPRPGVVLSSLEHFLATATVSGSELAAYFTTAPALVKILASAAITDSRLAEYLHTQPPYVVGDEIIVAGHPGVVVAGTTYSVAPSGVGEGLVYVNGKPVAETAVPEVSGGDSMAEVLTEMAAESMTKIGSRPLETSFSAGVSYSFDQGTSTLPSSSGTKSRRPSSTGTSTSTSVDSSTPTLQNDASHTGALRLSSLLFCMLLCLLALM